MSVRPDMEAASHKKSQSCEIYTPRREIHNYHGVVHALNLGTKEEDQNSNGTLSIVQEGDRITIEWRPNEVSLDTECQEEEWALVNTKSRTRTYSGSCESGGGVGGQSSKPGGGGALCIPIQELASLKVSNRKNKLTLFLKENRQKVFFFHFENVNHFIEELRSVAALKKSYHDGSTFLVKPGAQYAESGRRKSSGHEMPQSFSELSLADCTGSGGGGGRGGGGEGVWRLVDGLKHSPYETTLSTFSKLTEILLYRTPESRSEGDMVELINSSLGPVEGGEVDESYHVVSPLSGPVQLEPRCPPLSAVQWEASMDGLGRVISPLSIRDAIFKGGVNPSLRAEVWKFLLGYFPWNSTRAEREDIVRQKTEEYFRMKMQWKTISVDQESRFTFYREKKNLVEKDVNRTDRTMPFYAGENNPNLGLLSDILMTYIMYNFDLGYVQGMSDLLSPILAVTSSEVEAFWCFVGFMNIMYHNFDEDQSGMKKQLSQLHTLLTAVAPDLSSYLDSHDAGSMCFCFRWLLVWFKREFTADDIMTLWEVLWTGLPCSNFHLVICVAILEKEKTTLMSNNFGLTEILKHVNDLSYHMDLNEILQRATAIYKQLDVSTNLTVSTQRVLGLSSDLSKRQSHLSTSSDGKSSDLSLTDTSNLENGYDKSIDLNYF